MKPQLDWARLPKLFDWRTNQPDPQPDITVAASLWAKVRHQGCQLFLWEAQCEAMAWLCKVANVDQG